MPRFMEEAHGWTAMRDWDMFADCLQNCPPKLSVTFRSANQNPIKLLFLNAKMAEGVGFEPTVLLRVQRFSSLMAAVLPRIGPV